MHLDTCSQKPVIGNPCDGALIMWQKGAQKTIQNFVASEPYQGSTLFERLNGVTQYIKYKTSWFFECHIWAWVIWLFYYVMPQSILCPAHSTLHALHIVRGKDLKDILISYMFLNARESISSRSQLVKRCQNLKDNRVKEEAKEETNVVKASSPQRIKVKHEVRLITWT